MLATPDVPDRGGVVAPPSSDRKRDQFFGEDHIAVVEAPHVADAFSIGLSGK